PDLRRKAARQSRAAGGYERSGPEQAIHGRAAPSNGSRLAYLLEISRRRRTSERTEMEIAGRMENWRDPVADSAKDYGPGGYSNLRLSRRSPAHAGNHAARFNS